MSIWGKIIGGTAGFALGGPIGGLVGAIAGHGVDHLTTSVEADRQAAFSIALIALSAKMAKADGIVTRDEILAFREKVDVPARDMDAVGKIWDRARETPDGFEGYASQVAKLFPKGSAILEELMGLLFHIAHADGKFDANEEIYLRRVAEIFGFDDAGFEHLGYVYGTAETSPYRLLEINPDCSNDELRQAWLRMARRHHPDQLMAEGLPEEFVRAANDQLARINAAYETLVEQRRS